MNLSNNTEKLISMIHAGDEFNIFKGDIKAFQWLRTDGKKTLVAEGLGGGNLTLALIAVTQLDLLGQCYVLLSNQAKFNRNGDINQTDAFWKLVRDNTTKWGFTKNQILLFWKRVRHKLVHQSYPKAQITVPRLEDFEHLKELRDWAATKRDAPFRIENDVVIVRADALLASVEQIKSELIAKLKSGEFAEARIKQVIDFVTK